MKRLPVSATLMALVIGLAGCSGSKGAKADKAEAKTLDVPAIAVQVAPAGLGVIQNALVLNGDIRPAKETQISSKIQGRLMELLVTEGTTVAAGQVIARLDQSDLKLQLLQSEASMAAARANLASAETNLATAKDGAQRFEALHKAGAISDQQMIGAKAQVDAARNTVRASEAQIAQAKAAIALLKSQLANAEIRAPFAGAVTKKFMDVGAMVPPMNPIVTLASLQDLEIKVPVGQASLAHMKPGVQATFTVPTYPGKTFGSKVREVAPTLDARTRTAMVTLSVPNQDGQLSPGMYARVTLPTIKHESVVVLPADAVVADGEETFVFLAQGDKAVRKPVKTGLRDEQRIEVIEGLSPGEPVVVKGQGQLQEGDKIAAATNGGTR